MSTLLRFATCGSVDDGKSTLIGRLLHDSGNVPDDQMAAVVRDSEKFGTVPSGPDYALLVDGLTAERQQGITIDVAYRYFSTERRAFIVADCPGHEQYTRNMATGASTCDLAVLLVDARKGIAEQTRRHAYIVAMVGVRHVVLAVNKMDTVQYAAEVFRLVVEQFELAAAPLQFDSITAIPVCARNGDNVATRSPHMPWYAGPTVLACLETASAAQPPLRSPGRLPVQWVNRPNDGFRGFAGTLASGVLRVGDAVKIQPSGQSNRIDQILGPSGDARQARAGEAVTVLLERQTAAARGDVIVADEDDLRPSRHCRARLLWMAHAPMAPETQYLLKVGTAEVRAQIGDVEEYVDITTYGSQGRRVPIVMNEIFWATLDLDRPTLVDEFKRDKTLGAFILIHPVTKETAAMGVIEEATTHWADWTGLSWILTSFVLLFGGATALSGDPLLGFYVAAGDLLLRPLLKRWHDRLWRH